MDKRWNRQVGMVALVAALLLASSSSPFAQEDHANLPPPDQVEILSAVRQYYEDLSARDWERFAANFWEGATIATVWQPEGEDSPRVVINTIPEFVARAPEGPGSKSIFEETMGQSKILVYQNLAIAWVEYDARFGEPDDLMEWSGIDGISLLKDRGEWKITSIAFASEL